MKRYEARELNGEMDKQVRALNTYLPKNTPIFGVFDNIKKEYVIEDKYSESPFWTCMIKTAELGANHLNEEEDKK